MTPAEALALKDLEVRAWQWLEARAAGHDTYKADRHLGAAMMTFRKAERRARKGAKR